MDFLEYIIIRFIHIYSMLIFVYIIMSWIPGARESQIGYFLGTIIEPFLEPFRRIIPPIGGMLDISPIVALFVLRALIPLGIHEIFSVLKGIIG